jgi:hypothetical protein
MLQASKPILSRYPEPTSRFGRCQQVSGQLLLLDGTMKPSV